MKITIDSSKLKGITEAELSKAMGRATAFTLTQAAFSSRLGVQAMLKSKLTIRRVFLPRSVVYDRATPQRLESFVYFLDRATLVNLLESGGMRQPKGRAIAVPTARAKGRTGSISKGRRPRALTKKTNFFVATIAGTLGIWQKLKGNQLALIYSLKSSTRYRPRTITFHATVENVAAKVLQRRLWTNLLKNLNTMR